MDVHVPDEVLLYSIREIDTYKYSAAISGRRSGKLVVQKLHSETAVSVNGWDTKGKYVSKYLSKLPVHRIVSLSRRSEYQRVLPPSHFQIYYFLMLLTCLQQANCAYLKLPFVDGSECHSSTLNPNLYNESRRGSQTTRNTQQSVLAEGK